MIALIIFSIFCFVIIWFVVFKVILIYQKRNLFKNIPEKLEKQDKRFFNDGKEVNFKELLGKEATKKEVVEEVKEEPIPKEPEETITDTEPQEEEPEEIIEPTEPQPEEEPTLKELPKFEGDKFKLPGKEE